MKSLIFFILVFSFLLVKQTFSQDTIVFRAGPEGKYANLWTYHPDNNYGHTALFHTMGWTYWGEQGIIRSLIAFDLSSIPPNAFILNAKLSLYYLNTQPDPNIQPGENSSYLQLITSAWNEETVTWNNPPSTTPEDQVYLPQSTEPEQDYPDIDVTIPIRKMHDEPVNYFGLMLRLINEDPYACMLFASGDCDSTELRPKLEIIYMECSAPPAAGFTYSTEGLTVSFQDTSVMAAGYYWDFGDGYFSSLSNPTHTYDINGSYLVCLMAWNSCGADTSCQVLELCSPPVGGFDFEFEDMTVYFENTTILADEYYWDFGDGYYSNLENPWHNYESEGNYEVCLTTWNSCGADTTCETLNFSSVSVGEKDAGSFIMYPNPARDVVFIKQETEGFVAVSLIDLSGKEVMRQKLELKKDELIQLPLGQIEQGIYIVRYDSGKSQTFGKLVVLE